MRKAKYTKRSTKSRTARTLIVRLDEESKGYLTEAARLRRISVSDYVRQVTVAQAEREVLAAARQTILLTADEQLKFWNALNAPVRITPKQRELGRLMRGTP
jgi:uncharacterized protein (DUF1778 family)